MKNNLVILLSFVLISNLGHAQLVEETNLYELNKLKLNPAFAGESDCGEVHIGHLGQLSRFNGAPQVSYINGSAVIAKNMSLGGKVNLDRLGSLTRFNIQGIYAYKLNFGDDHNLRLGVAVGINQQSFDFSGSTIQVPTDPSLIMGREKGASFYTEAGLVYTIKRFQLSFSVPNLMETTTNLSPTTGVYTNRRQMIGYMGYRFGELNKISLTPSIMYKNGSAGQHQVEGNVLVNFKNRLQLGFGYRHNAGILGRFGLNISDKFQVGYAYGFALTDLAKVSSGSHEFLLGFKLCNKTRKMPIDVVPMPGPVTDPVIDTVYIDGPVIIDTVVVEKIVKEEKVDLEHTIYYKQSESTFDANKEKAELAKVVSYLKENKDAVIYIKGYASEEGTEFANFELSGDRAKNVYAYLLKQGVSRSQMISLVQGEAAEHHGPDDKETYSENRRVTIVLK